MTSTAIFRTPYNSFEESGTEGTIFLLVHLMASVGLSQRELDLWRAISSITSIMSLSELSFSVNPAIRGGLRALGAEISRRLYSDDAVQTRYGDENEEGK